ncbi:ABC transporter permease [Ferruginivarius sediminum]|uniref:ABC transporter permease n=1 Tax=Ferruginivarius sediminum TaxID=2661937 RepID=A0A369TC45_9PROT|nr:ABC transporter permease [Ferruginivarius sediminum]RDD61975.1 ABC transporter permease [Ferruginivarius sediminum]
MATTETDARAAGLNPSAFSEIMPRLRKPIIVLGLVALWEAWVRLFDVPELLFPAFSDVLVALITGLGIGGEPILWAYTWQTLSVVLQAYVVSVVLAVVLTGFAINSAWGKELLSTVTGIFQPLPSIALLPMAVLWFGFSKESLIFVVVMSMVWPLAASLTVGFATVPPTLLRLGRNYELSRLGAMWHILLPSALPAMIGGLRVGWGFGWRTIVAAELVFGATGNDSGIGWYINNSRVFLQITEGFAGILVVVIIGFITESLFRVIQRFTTHRWGMEAA